MRWWSQASDSSVFSTRACENMAEALKMANHAETAQQRWEEDTRAALKVRERLDQAEAFIEHQDMSYRYAEWLGQDEEALGSESE